MDFAAWCDICRTQQEEAKKKKPFRHRLWESVWGGQVGPTTRYSKVGWLKAALTFPRLGRVSQFHLYEAQERYLLLRRMLNYHSPSESGIRSPEKCERYREQHRVVHLATEILDAAQHLLTRRQEHLNYLWRDLSRVHIMLVEKLLPDPLLLGQTDFFREEARRLRAAEEPGVRDLTERLADDTPKKSEERPLGPIQKEAVIRDVRAAINRFTAIRAGRIHEQFVTIRTYRNAFFFLLVVSALLIANYDVVLKPQLASSARVSSTQPRTSVTANSASRSGTAGSSQNAAGEDSHDERRGNDKLALDIFGWLSVKISGLIDAGYDLHQWFKECLRTNILLFVFCAGLLGGLFSAVTRLRDRDLIPGEDAYFLWYVLTKPAVGALGAVIFFILLLGNFVELTLFPASQSGGFSQDLFGAAPNWHYTRIFGFSFLAGFSERLVFPQLKVGSRRSQQAAQSGSS